MTAKAPRVAVIGRPNVGKSTLVNRLIGRRQAISHETPGVTRDRTDALAHWGDRSIVLTDTGGVVERPEGLGAAVSRQASRAMELADLALLVVDVTTGVTAEDEAIARGLRDWRKPVLVVANKVDSEFQEPLAAEFFGLGLGEPVPVSALHGRGSGELLDLLDQLLPEGAEPELEGEDRFSIVGRANVGKSLIFNRLVREDRAIVHEVAGTTRDAVDQIIEVGERRVRFVDTAGFRRSGKAGPIEYYGVVRTQRAIDAADVALLVIDAAEGLTGLDKRVAARVVEAGRGLAVALNKWDLVPSEERAALFSELRRQLEIFPGVPVLRTSALTGSGVRKILPALFSVAEAWKKRIGTAEVNRVVQAAVDSYPPPGRMGRVRYATQVSAGPPRFVLFGTNAPSPSYRRYLENTLRRAFGFHGVPVRLSFRGRPPRHGHGGEAAASGGAARGRPEGRAEADRSAAKRTGASAGRGRAGAKPPRRRGR